jgi:hypothetical protein
VVHTLDEAPVLAEHLEREAAADEVVEDARVAARDVHAAAEGTEVHVNVVGLRRRGGCNGAGSVPAATVAAEDDGISLHVVLEALALQLRKTDLQIRRRRAAACSPYWRRSGACGRGRWVWNGFGVMNSCINNVSSEKISLTIFGVMRKV